MLDPHDDTDVPSGSTDGAQMESTSSPVPRLQHWLIPKARGNNMEHYTLPLGMANRVWLRTRIASMSQSHALSWRGRAAHWSSPYT